MKLIAGLGNPGSVYIDTPHNIGFNVVELLAEQNRGVWKKSARFNALVANINIFQHKLWLIKPQTFMNLSGQSIAAIAHYHKIAPAELVVVFDDANLELGRLRVRPVGGSGGHQGVNSIITALGTENFPRLRLGVGRPAGYKELTGHVLGKFGAEDAVVAGNMVERAATALHCMVTEGLGQTMNRYNALSVDEKREECNEQQGTVYEKV